MSFYVEIRTFYVITICELVTFDIFCGERQYILNAWI